LLLDQETQTLSVAAIRGTQEQTVWQDGPLHPGTPVGDALLDRRPLYFEHAEALKSACPQLEEQTGGLAAVATTVQPLVLEGQPLGVLTLDFKEPHTFTLEERRFLTNLASQSALAISRAQLIASLDTQVQLKTAELQAEQAALQAFVTFSRMTADTTDVYQLAERAIEVLHAVLQDVSVGYYERADDLWQARVWSNNMPAQVVEVIRTGLQVSAPNFSAVMRSRATLFIPGFDAAAEGAPEGRIFETAAFFPCLLEGEIRGILVMGTQVSPDWSPSDRQVFEAVGSSLTVALERTQAARRMQGQKEEMERRNQVLEAFAALSAELNVQQGPYELIQRVQEIILSLLPDGHAMYWEPVDGLWKLQAQSGELGNPALEAVIAAGISLGQLSTIDRPWQTGEPEYHDRYAVGQDLPTDLTGHIQSVTALPVFQGETLRRVLNFALHDVHTWRTSDQVVAGDGAAEPQSRAGPTGAAADQSAAAGRSGEPSAGAQGVRSPVSRSDSRDGPLYPHPSRSGTHAVPPDARIRPVLGSGRRPLGAQVASREYRRPGVAAAGGRAGTTARCPGAAFDLADRHPELPGPLRSGR